MIMLIVSMVPLFDEDGIFVNYVFPEGVCLPVQALQGASQVGLRVCHYFDHLVQHGWSIQLLLVIRPQLSACSP